VLSGANTYSGATIISTIGTLRLQHPDSAGTRTLALQRFGQLGLVASQTAIVSIAGVGAPVYDTAGKYGGALYLNGARR
jgi:autotransporter-associated beta strand protein